tara:strand:+ start:273 stop:569 length:297 start_codon:yes stop_codon:yes gene_type:complete
LVSLLTRQLPHQCHRFSVAHRQSTQDSALRFFHPERLDTKKHKVSGVKLYADGLVAEGAAEGLAGDRLFQIDVRNVASRGGNDFCNGKAYYTLNRLSI